MWWCHPTQPRTSYCTGSDLPWPNREHLLDPVPSRNRARTKLPPAGRPAAASPRWRRSASLPARERRPRRGHRITTSSSSGPTRCSNLVRTRTVIASTRSGPFSPPRIVSRVQQARFGWVRPPRRRRAGSGRGSARAAGWPGAAAQEGSASALQVADDAVSRARRGRARSPRPRSPGVQGTSGRAAYELVVADDPGDGRRPRPAPLDQVVEAGDPPRSPSRNSIPSGTWHFSRRAASAAQSLGR